MFFYVFSFYYSLTLITPEFGHCAPILLVVDKLINVVLTHVIAFLARVISMALLDMLYQLF